MTPSPPKVALIVLNWNGKEDTIRCLTSVEKITYPNMETIIVDNGSTDDSVKELRKRFPTATLIETGVNLGYAGGNNVGLEYALKEGADFFFILNNDTVVDPHIVEGFLQTFATHPEAGIFGGKIYLMDDPNRLDHLGGKWEEKRLDFTHVGHHFLDDGKSYESPIELDYVCGAGIMVRRAVLEKVGLFDPRFFLFFEESDLCFRARRAGFKVMSCPTAKLWHKVSASFTGGKPYTDYFYWRNRFLFILKNGKRTFPRLILLGIAIPHFSKRIALSSLQVFFREKLLRKGRAEERRKKLKKYRASLCGVLDYLYGNFGAGRSDLFSRP